MVHFIGKNRKYGIQDMVPLCGHLQKGNSDKEDARRHSCTHAHIYIGNMMYWSVSKNLMIHKLNGLFSSFDLLFVVATENQLWLGCTLCPASFIVIPWATCIAVPQILSKIAALALTLHHPSPLAHWLLLSSLGSVFKSLSCLWTLNWVRDIIFNNCG